MANQGNSTAEKSAHAAPGEGESKELHFYPGEKRLVFLVEHKPSLNVEAWGGPNVRRRRVSGDKHAAEPTPAGRFRIGWVGRYQTGTWPWALIPWGTHLKPDPHNVEDVLYEASPNRWLSVQKKTNINRTTIEDYYEQLYGVSAVPDQWVFNEFGSIAIRYYEDKNNNRQREQNEPLMGQMLHSTATSEANPTEALYESHGCIHLRPLDRDNLLARGAFEIGTLLVVHRYQDTSGLGARTGNPP